MSGDLFGRLPPPDPAPSAAPPAPLADRMRPRTLDEVLGQEEILGQGRLLRRLLDAGRLPSLLLWGPPGSGKTTLARLLAARAGARFEPLSAVTGGVADVRRAVKEARERRATGGSTVLFVDEIHRFNRAQQDALLPHVEDGTITFVGATTENPSFEVNGALLSRTRVVVLRPLDGDALRTLLRRALGDAERGCGGRGVALEPEAEAALVAAADGDGRRLLNLLEAAVDGAREDGPGGGLRVSAALVGEALQRTLRHDAAGDSQYDLASALQKSIRDSDPDGGVYWLTRMLEAGEDPLFVARRLVRMASEDVGLADPQALPLAVAARDAVHFLGMPEGALALAELAVYLALAPKSNSVGAAYGAARAAVEERGSLPVPLHLRNAPTPLLEGLGHGAGYVYAHDVPDGVTGQEMLPAGLEGRRFYEPRDRGFEREMIRRLRWWRERRAEVRRAAAAGDRP